MGFDNPRDADHADPQTRIARIPADLPTRIARILTGPLDAAFADHADF